MRILYSFNKTGYEADCWQREIAGATTPEAEFIPFNHGLYLDVNLYLDAVQLDRLYQAGDPRLMRMYAEFESLIRESHAEAILVTNCPPYHPDFLRRLSIYKVLYSTDDPGATYKRNIPYLHGYDHVMFCDPVYSPDMDMTDKMRYCGVRNVDWLPLGVFDFEHAPGRTETELFSGERDIDVIYVGGFFRQKAPLIARVGKALGSRLRIHGFFAWKHNLYMLVAHGYGSFIRPVSFQERVNLYQRAKIGFNMHWNDYGLGNQRLYHLPANGVMQISDCAPHLSRVFEEGTEVVGYRDVDDLIDKIRFYLAQPELRIEIARRGYRRVMRDYRLPTVMRKAAIAIVAGMGRPVSALPMK